MSRQKTAFLVFAAAALVGACTGTSASAPASPSASSAHSEPISSQAEPTAPAEATKINFRFDYTPQASDIPVLAAIDQGFFKDNGVEVATTVGSGSNDSVQLTGAGQHDMAIAGALAVISGAEQQIPVKSVGIIYQVNPSVWVTLPDVCAKTPKDFEGLKVGTQPDSVGYQFYQVMLSKNNVDKSKITEVPIGFGVEPLLAKQVDVMNAFRNAELIAIRKQLGAEPCSFPDSDFGVNPQSQSLIVNKDFAAQHPDAVKGFVKAFAQGQQWAIENPDKAVDLIVQKYPELDRADVKDALDATLPLWVSADTATNGLLHMDMDRWQKDTIDLAKETGIIKSELKAEDVATNEFLPDPPITASP